jgi:hypothetical protein
MLGTWNWPIECVTRFFIRFVLQQQWEISRQYAIFATPVAYLIDPGGLIVADIAVGADAILDMMSKANDLLRAAQEIAAL